MNKLGKYLAPCHKRIHYPVTRGLATELPASMPSIVCIHFYVKVRLNLLFGSYIIKCIAARNPVSVVSNKV